MKIRYYISKFFSLFEKKPIYPHIGMYVFKNKKISKYWGAYPDVIGVIVGVNLNKDVPEGKRILVLLLNEHAGTWQKAMDFCAHYHPLRIDDPLFLPTREQWKQILQNRKLISKACEKANGVRLMGLYWSSSDHDILSAWRIDAVSMRSMCDLKACMRHVRMAFFM